MLRRVRSAPPLLAGRLLLQDVHPSALALADLRAVLKRLAGLGAVHVSRRAPGDLRARARCSPTSPSSAAGRRAWPPRWRRPRPGRASCSSTTSPSLGGHLLDTRRGRLRGDARPGWQIAAALAADVAASRGSACSRGATVFGLYEDGLLGCPAGPPLREAPGRSDRSSRPASLEHPIVFENNDRPGVMLGGGARRLAALYGVRPGARAVVAAVGRPRGSSWPSISARPASRWPPSSTRAPRRPSRPRRAALRRRARRSSRAVRPSWPRVGRERVRAGGDRRPRPAAAAARELPCDLVCLATASSRRPALLGQAGRAAASRRGRAGGSCRRRCLPTCSSAGEVAGLDGPRRRSSPRAGSRGPRPRCALGGREAVSARGSPSCARRWPRPGRGRAGRRAALAARRRGGGAKQFVCLCEDVTEKELTQGGRRGLRPPRDAQALHHGHDGPVPGQDVSPAVDRALRRAHGPDRRADRAPRPPGRPQPVPLGALAGPPPAPVQRTPLHHERHDGARARAGSTWATGSAAARLRRGRRRVPGRPRGGRPDRRQHARQARRPGRDAARVPRLAPSQPLQRPARRARALPRDVRRRRHHPRRRRRSPGSAPDRFFVSTTTGNLDAIDQWLDVVAGGRRPLRARDRTSPARSPRSTSPGPRAREILRRAHRRRRVAGGVAVPRRAARATSPACPRDHPAHRLRRRARATRSTSRPTTATHLWDALMDAGRPLGLRPFGVEAQRVLRLEKQHAIVGAGHRRALDARSRPAWAGARQGRQAGLHRSRRAARRRRAGALRQRLVGFEIAGHGAPARARARRSWPTAARSAG